MSNQLTLSYEELPKLATRDYLRENFKHTAKECYKVAFGKIGLREGYNKRIVYDFIEELADSIFIHGQKEPFVLYILPDGRYLIKRGHRRYKAYLLLIEQGRFNPETEVEFYPVNPKETEFEGMVDQYTSNNLQNSLKPIEQAAVVFEAKFNYGKEYSNEELATIFGISRQKVDNLIIFAQASDDVKLAIRELKFTAAVDYIREEKKRKKQADKAEIDAGQSSMYITPDNKDVNADELKELNDLEKEIALQDEENVPDNETHFVNEDTGEVVEKIQEEITISPSVITEPVAEKQKGTYDESRPEIQWCQNIIKLLDKVDNIASKIPDPQASKDICDRVKWMHKDMEELREWVSKNKKQNKIR